MAEPTHDEHLTQIRDRSRRLAEIPLETSASNYIMRDMIDSIGDVRWLMERLGNVREEWTLRHPSGNVGIVTYKADAIPRLAELNPTCTPVCRFVGEWKAAEQQPEDGDRG